MPINPQNASSGLTAQPQPPVSAQVIGQQGPAAGVSVGGPSFTPGLAQQAQAAGATSPIVQGPAAGVSLGGPTFNADLINQAQSAGATNPITAAFVEASDAQPFTQEAATAFEDENTSALYLALRQKGLNPLRSEIVAICEFIPVSRGENSENAAEINYELSANQSLSVTNVARLIELHRQIRDYVSEAARLVLLKAYPDMAEETFLRTLRLAVRQAYSDEAGISVQSTFERIFNRLQIAPASGSNASSFFTVIAENVNSAFLKAIVEYYVYEKLIEDIIGYVGSMGQLDLQLTQNFDITKFSNLKTFSSQDTFSENKLSQLFGNVANTHLTSTPEQLSKEGLGLVRTQANSDTDMFLNSIGQLVSAIYFKDSSAVLSTLSQADDSSLTVEPGKIRLGIRGDLANAISELKKVTFTGCIAYLGSGTGAERTGDLGGQYNSNVALNNDSFFDAFNSIENAVGESQSTETGYHELLTVMAYDVLSANIDYVGSFNGIQSRLKTINALPDGSVFSSNFSLQRATYGNDVSFAYPNFLSNFIETTTGIPISKFSSNQKEIIDRNLVPSKSNSTNSIVAGFGTFTRDVLGIRTVTNQNGTTEKYMPLESTEKEPHISEDGVPLRTAADYYVQNAVLNTTIQTNYITGEEELSLDFSNMENDVAQYSVQAENFVHDILTLVPDHKLSNQNAPNSGMTPLGRGDVIDYLRFLLGELEEDLEQILSDGNNSTSSQIPILATMLRSTTTSNRVKNFAGVFWGIIEAGNDFFIGKTASFEDINDEDVDFELPNESDIPKLNTNNQRNRVQKIIAHFVEFYNEDAAKSFLRDNCNLSLNPKGVNATRKFQGGSNVSYSLGLGDNSANIVKKAGVRDKLPAPVDITGRNNPGSGTETLAMTAAKVDNRFDDSFGGGTGERLEEVVGAANIGKTLLAAATVIGAVAAVSAFVAASVLAAIATGGASILMTAAAAASAASTATLVGGILVGVSLASLGSSLYLEWTQAKVYGMARVLKRSMYSAMTGNYASIGYFVDNENQLNAGHDIMLGTGFVQGSIRPNPGVIGNIAGLSTQHRGLIWYQWVNLLLRKTLRIEAKTVDTNLELTLFKDNVKGVIDAIRVARGASATYNLTGNAGYDHALLEAQNYINSLFGVVNVRQEKIRDAAALVKAHAEGLTKFKNLVENTLSGKGTDGSIDKGTQLAIAVMKEENVFNDVVTLNSDMMPSLMYQAASRNLFSQPGSLFTQDMKFSIAKNKYMYKTLSTPGFGFLESEKRGNKSIINVGIPNSMIKALQQRGAERTGNSNFLTSPYVCVSVYKQDHMNKSYTFFPKNFVFDTSANIADYSLTGGLANHLLNFAENDSFESLLGKTEVHRFKSDTTGRIRKKSLIGVPNGVYSSEILTNHVHDYCLKEYFRLTTGLNFDEENFLASTTTLDFTKIIPSSYIGTDLQNEYNRLIQLLTKLYPNAEEDPRFRSEVFRLTAILRQSIPFSGRNRFIKTITPKSFDRVYSLIVNEKDFVIDDRPKPNASSNPLAPLLNQSISNDQLFTSPVNFNLNGGLERPGEVNPGFLYVASGQNNNLGALGNYIASLDENYPEVYNYYVTVSLLPLQFQLGADLKFTNDDIIAAQEATETLAAAVEAGPAPFTGTENGDVLSSLGARYSPI